MNLTSVISGSLPAKVSYIIGHGAASDTSGLTIVMPIPVLFVQPLAVDLTMLPAEKPLIFLMFEVIIIPNTSNSHLIETPPGSLSVNALSMLSMVLPPSLPSSLLAAAVPLAHATARIVASNASHGLLFCMSFPP